MDRPYTKMDNLRQTTRLFDWVPRGRPRNRWRNDMEEELRSLGVTGWRRLAANGDAWRRVVPKPIEPMEKEEEEETCKRIRIGIH